MKILTYDLATQTGWCYGAAGSVKPEFGSFKLPSTGDDIGTFALAARRKFEEMLVPGEVEMVCFEKPLFLIRGNSNINTAMKLMGLAVVLEMLCVERGIAVYHVDQQTWKKHFVGRASFSKKTKPYPPMVVCHDKGWETANDDESDACGVWDLACHEACPEKARVLDPLAIAAGGW